MKVYLKPSLNGVFSKAKPAKNFTNKNLVTQKFTYDRTICVNNKVMARSLNFVIQRENYFRLIQAAMASLYCFHSSMKINMNIAKKKNI